MLALRRKPRFWIALVTGIVLALQALAFAGSAAAMPMASQLDAFGNPLCIGGSTHNGADRGDDHSKMPNCCAWGCSMASSTLAAPPNPGIGLLRPLVQSTLLSFNHALISVGFPDHDPASPRAPPPSA